MSDTSADPTPIRHELLNRGYMPTPVCPPGCTHVDRRGKPCKSGGKAVHISGWTKGTFTPNDIWSWHRTRPQDSNTGIRTGEVCAVDADILDVGLAMRVDALADQHLGPTPLRRIGRAPKWLRCYRAEAPISKLETPERRLNGETVQVEIMGEGQQVAAYGTHPTTMKPYTWLEREPLNTPLSELPMVSEDQLRTFLAAADALFAAAGAVLVVQPKTGSPSSQSDRKSNGSAASGANGASRTAGGDSFFKQVNRAALANLSRWVPRLFPNAALQQTGAYRVHSVDLGRDFEEDLSLHPDGIRDFGPRRGLSPCDVVLEFGGAPTIQDAALTMCEWLGRDPAKFGWKAKPREPNGADTAPEPPPSDGSGSPLFDPWAELQPPTFPIDALSPVHRAFTEDRARIMGADPCALAWAAISAASAALDGSIRLRMKRHDNWSVPPAIWLALVGRSSTKKSPIIDAAWEPLHRAQRIDLDHWRQQLANWRALPKNERSPEEPKPRRRLVSHDGTMEALQDILGRQDRGIGVLRDELAGWLSQLEKYVGAKASGADRAFFLQAYNGGPNVIDRVARGLIAVNNLLVTICGGIQPERLRQFSDLTDDGLWQRFVPIIVGEATRGLDEQPGSAVADYADAINRILTVPAATRVELSHAAQDLRVEIEQKVFDLQQSDVLGARFASFCGKLDGLWGRLCLVLNYLDPTDTHFIVPLRTAERAAVLLFQSVIPCAARVYAATGGAGADVEATRSVAGYILTKKKARVLASDLAHNVRACRGQPLDHVQRVVSPLVAGGWLTPEKDWNPFSWQVAPDVHCRFEARAEREAVRRAAIRDVITGKSDYGVNT